MARRTRPESAQTVADLLRALSANLDALDEQVAEAFGIGRTDLRAMEVISRKQTPTAGELARELGLTTGAVTGLVDRLVRAGYVLRVADRSDRRRVVVQLTSHGRERERRIFGPVLTNTLRVVRSYTAGERGLLADFLRRIAAVTGTRESRAREGSSRSNRG